ncbi:class I SAM-dependent methyltransferase [Yokenella regensburgei]|uniref:class I SAM-dependent methyltransferase n=1 Tax=Yokenella regensburgei TaxID=158877 RepID=UPI0035AE9448
MTMNFYQRHAAQFFADTVSVDMASLYAPFIAMLAPGAVVLDAGCGSGRDTKAFKEMGFNVEAFDASAEMVALAAEHAGVPVQQMSFSELNATRRYDGIWCCASLLHVPAEELPGVMQRLAAALKVGGVWYVSFKYGDGERVKEGRHFTDLNELALGELVKMLPGIRLHSTWQTEDRRPGRDDSWLNALLCKA